MRIIFMGSPESALPTLHALLASPHDVIAIVSQQDRPSGRGQKIHSCPVAATARDRKIPLYQPERAKDPSFIETFQGFKADLAIIVAYGKILPNAILEAPRFGCWNVHFSLLPEYRGAAPVQWALINGETKTGVSVHHLVEKLDAGPILAQAEETVREDDDVPSLEMRLADVGAHLCLQTLADLESGSLTETSQDEAQATLAPMLKKSDGQIDWKGSATSIVHRIRGLKPWPGAYTFLPTEAGTARSVVAEEVPQARAGGATEGSARGTPAAPRVDKVLLKLYSAESLNTEPGAEAGTIIQIDPKQGLEVACGTGTLRIHEVQLAGKARMSAGDFLRGHRLVKGTKLLSE